MTRPANQAWGWLLGLALAGAMLAAVAATPATTATAATVARPGVKAHAKPDFASPEVATLEQAAAVQVTGQQGLWFKLALAGGKSGYVRVNDVRVAYASKQGGGIGKALFTGKAGKGRVTETASVRGIDESALKSASFDAERLQEMESYRATPEAAEEAAGKRGWQATLVPYAVEYQPRPAKPGKQGKPRASQAETRERFGIAGKLASHMGSAFGGVLSSGSKLVGKSEQEIVQEELELGPMIAGRILGAVPLLQDPAAQQRVNLVGRWLASRSSRPELPWTFGVIDDGEINAFAAPGGYILVTRGLYQLLENDAEVAAVLSHELSHVVQRDHYEVLRKQELQGAGKELVSSQVRTGGGLAGSVARGYIERNGAAIMLTQLDRNAEYRADQAAGIYLARAGTNPLAYYAVLQKMASLGTSSPRLTHLYKTHPPLDKRLDALDANGYANLQAYLDR
ncbi:MAG: M48 family metalloprotease [Thermomonas sp.]|uniref:M48 family metalloprotease n=1 Tax=Thermomonas sp. TaxID=1971895 RepID=UPI001B62F538|nr:M48 family metalloprotease [Thermomonas sp.]MBK7204764.1 M48 family metalloprotease [Thermomonas sp.]MBP7157707.1 M48 family metalloprotease [Thermomonas sp.]MBP7788871.1 M48 family metalloprotease [Thermomonas sp.]MBP8614709.1 M48 family metalloprotease [Thermomonas sp.]MBP8647850.1 M48 family metalloprotease [Thermomonas sp.]